VPVVNVVLAFYEAYLTERMACGAANECDFVFVNLFHEPLGGPMSYSSVRQMLAGLSQRAGLSRPVTAHMLRHSMGTELAEVGVGIDVVQELLGHASILTTQRYVNPSRRRLREAVEALESLTVKRSKGPTSS
jgi:site-specific recombinase XerD